MSSEIRVKEKESLDSALRRFKKSCARSGIIQEVRKREAYEKPSVRRKKKSEAARKRKYKLFRRSESAWLILKSSAGNAGSFGLPAFFYIGGLKLYGFIQTQNAHRQDDRHHP